MNIPGIVRRNWLDSTLVVAVVAAIIFLIVCLGGCGDKLTVEEKVTIWKETTTFLKENRIAGQASLSSAGDGAVYAKQSFGLDTGLQLHVAAQFNATEGDAVTSPNP